MRLTDRERREGASSSERLPRVESITHGFADEDQQRQHDGEAEEAGNAEPRGIQMALALPQQLAKRRRAWRHAEAEKVERAQRGDRAIQNEGQEGESGDH